MAETVVAAHNLHFGFSKNRLVVQELNMQVTAGATYGFLGPNGAGKSTTLKLLLGLLNPTAGHAELFSIPVHRQASPQLFTRVGALLESPAVYPHLSARQNLRLLATYRNLPNNRIEKVLVQVHLQKAADRKVSEYSTGMKQRLGIAQALLPEPDLLILDEPTNGLDPQGIREVRTLIQELGQQTSKTILVSSHILSEIEQTCDQVGIIHNKKLIFEGNIKQWKKQLHTATVVVETDKGVAAVALLAARGIAATALPDGQLAVQAYQPEIVTIIIDILRAAKVEIYQIRRQEQTLEDLYLSLLKEEEL